MGKNRNADELSDAFALAPTETERPVTPRQLARFLQVSPSTIGRQVRSGKLPYIKVGSQIRFLPSEVLAKIRKKDA